MTEKSEPSVFNQLGFDDPVDIKNGPPVDNDKLVAFQKKLLEGIEAERVAFLVVYCPEWRTRYLDLISTSRLNIKDEEADEGTFAPSEHTRVCYAAFMRDLPGLLPDHLYDSVAYHNGVQLDINESSFYLEETYAHLPAGELQIFLIEPQDTDPAGPTL